MTTLARDIADRVCAMHYADLPRGGDPLGEGGRP